MIFKSREESGEEVLAMGVSLVVIKKMFKEVIASSADEEERLGESILCSRAT